MTPSMDSERGGAGGGGRWSLLTRCSNNDPHKYHYHSTSSADQKHGLAALPSAKQHRANIREATRTNYCAT